MGTQETSAVTITPDNITHEGDIFGFTSEHKGKDIPWFVALNSSLTKTAGNGMAYRGYVTCGPEKFAGKTVTMLHNLSENTLKIQAV